MTFLKQLDAHYDNGCEDEDYLICPDETWTDGEFKLFHRCVETGFLTKWPACYSKDGQPLYGMEIDFEGEIPVKKYRDMRDAYDKEVLNGQQDNTSANTTSVSSHFTDFTEIIDQFHTDANGTVKIHADQLTALLSLLN